MSGPYSRQRRAVVMGALIGVAPHTQHSLDNAPSILLCAEILFPGMLQEARRPVWHKWCCKRVALTAAPSSTAPLGVCALDSIWLRPRQCAAHRAMQRHLFTALAASMRPTCPCRTLRHVLCTRFRHLGPARWPGNPKKALPPSLVRALNTAHQVSSTRNPRVAVSHICGACTQGPGPLPRCLVASINRLWLNSMIAPPLCWQRPPTFAAPPSFFIMDLHIWPHHLLKLHCTTPPTTGP